MSILLLDRLWLNRMDTGEAISARTDPDRSQSFTTETAVRTYANGRRRAISTVGEAGELTYTLIQLDLPTVTQLRSWAGANVNVQARDHRGQKWFGVFAAVQVGEYKDPGRYKASITVLTTTTVEGV